MKTSKKLEFWKKHNNIIMISGYSKKSAIYKHAMKVTNAIENQGASERMLMIAEKLGY